MNHFNRVRVARLQEQHLRWGRKGTLVEQLPGQHPRKQMTHRVQVLLKRHQSVLLQTPIWTEAEHFLGSIREQRTLYCTVDLNPFAQWSVTEIWSWTAQLLNEYIDDEAALPVFMSRSGFRAYLLQAFQRFFQKRPNTTAIVWKDIERLPLSLIEDVQRSWMDSVVDVAEHRRVPLLMTGAVEGGLLSRRMWLTDYGERELVQLSRQHPNCSLDLLVQSGGIPSFVLTLLRSEQPALSDWSSLLEQARRLVALISSERQRGDRLVSLAEGPQNVQYPLDGWLRQAGLIRIVGGQASLRAPILRTVINPR